MKYLKFKKCHDGHYIILGYKGIALGVVDLKGEVFKKRVVSREFEPDTEMTAECHRKLADFMDSLESKESAEPALHIAEHRQPKICPSCKSKMWKREVASGKCWNCGSYIDTTGKLRAGA